MYLPVLPDKVPYTLKEQNGQPDALVFVYEPLTPQQRARLFKGLRADADDVGVDMLYEVTRIALVEVVGLDIGGEAYSRDNPAHLRTLWAFWMPWMSEVASQVLTMSALTEEERGN